MRQLWHHRNMEMLQNKMTQYLSGLKRFSPRNQEEIQQSIRMSDCDRCEIQYAWEKFKKEFDESLAEMDQEAFSQMK